MDRADRRGNRRPPPAARRRAAIPGTPRRRDRSRSLGPPDPGRRLDGEARQQHHHRRARRRRERVGDLAVRLRCVADVLDRDKRALRRPKREFDAKSGISAQDPGGVDGIGSQPAGPGDRDVGTTLPRVSLGSGSWTTPTVEPVSSITSSASSIIVNSPDCRCSPGQDVAVEQREETAHLVADETEAPRLAAVAVDRQRLAAERLDDEVRHDPAVVDCMRGPYVLKMRTMRMSSPRARR